MVATLKKKEKKNLKCSATKMKAWSIINNEAKKLKLFQMQSRKQNTNNKTVNE